MKFHQNCLKKTGVETMILINKKKRLIKKIVNIVKKNSLDKNKKSDLLLIDNKMDSYYSDREMKIFNKENFLNLGINSIEDFDNLFNNSNYIISNKNELIELLKELYNEIDYNQEPSDEISPYVYEM